MNEGKYVDPEQNPMIKIGDDAQVPRRTIDVPFEEIRDAVKFLLVNHRAPNLNLSLNGDDNIPFINNRHYKEADPADIRQVLDLMAEAEAEKYTDPGQNPMIKTD